ncbi:response regulator [Derxia gummosa]|uniref:Response regulator n=1 Tax=Derxia gummosa DSM 723 TaxID=1121388 RepID=A0A8B6X3Y3_9BURK|nr:response regulator [Derxia gummosa]
MTPKKILVVDDSSSLRSSVRTALSGAGYEVVEAADGALALQQLDGRKFHLVISDLNMPNLDGIGLVTALKAKPAYRYTPVLMLTTESAAAKKEKAKAAGVKAWITKPFTVPVLLDTVSKLVIA